MSVCWKTFTSDKQELVCLPRRLSGSAHSSYTQSTNSLQDEGFRGDLRGQQLSSAAGAIFQVRRTFGGSLHVLQLREENLKFFIGCSDKRKQQHKLSLCSLAKSPPPLSINSGGAIIATFISKEEEEAAVEDVLTLAVAPVQKQQVFFPSSSTRTNLGHRTEPQSQYEETKLKPEEPLRSFSCRRHLQLPALQPRAATSSRLNSRRRRHKLVRVKTDVSASPVVVMPNS